MFNFLFQRKIQKQVEPKIEFFYLLSNPEDRNLYRFLTREHFLQNKKQLLEQYEMVTDFYAKTKDEFNHKLQYYIAWDRLNKGLPYDQSCSITIK